LRVRLLFAARRNEDGNVHRREGVSKTVTKNMWVVFFKNQKPKERPNLPADEAGDAPFGGKNITADTGVKTPSRSDARTTCFNARLLDAFVRLLATFGRLVDADDYLMKKSYK